MVALTSQPSKEFSRDEPAFHDSGPLKLCLSLDPSPSADDPLTLENTGLLTPEAFSEQTSHVLVDAPARASSDVPSFLAELASSSSESSESV